jgi:hypothetical protein
MSKKTLFSFVKKILNRKEEMLADSSYLSTYSLCCVVCSISSLYKVQ